MYIILTRLSLESHKQSLAVVESKKRKLKQENEHLQKVMYNVHCTLYIRAPFTHSFQYMYIHVYTCIRMQPFIYTCTIYMYVCMCVDMHVCLACTLYMYGIIVFIR